jgi:putative chitinase
LSYSLKNVCEIIGKHNKAVSDYAQPYVRNPKAVGDLRYEGGYNYRGRGILQLTHLGNYKAFQNHYNSKYSPAIDIVKNPDLVQTNTEIAVLSGLHYFNTRVMSPSGKYKTGVDMSGTTNATVDQVTLRVNGGYIQKADRRSIFKTALEKLF